MIDRGYIGRIRSVSGHDGSLVMGDCSPRLLALPVGATVYVGYSEQFIRPYHVRACHKAGNNGFMITLDGVQTAESARELVEMGVFVEQELERQHTDADYIESDIIGCMVVDMNTGEELGKVTEIWYMPANDVWVVDYHGKELPIPYIEPIVKSVDHEKKIISIKVMEGLLELAIPQSSDLGLSNSFT